MKKVTEIDVDVLFLGRLRHKPGDVVCLMKVKMGGEEFVIEIHPGKLGDIVVGEVRHGLDNVIAIHSVIGKAVTFKDIKPHQYFTCVLVGTEELCQCVKVNDSEFRIFGLYHANGSVSSQTGHPNDILRITGHPIAPYLK